MDLRPRRITKGVAQTVRSVRAFFEEERLQQQRISVSNVILRTAKATGLSERSVMRISSGDIDSFPDDDAPRATRSPLCRS